MSVKLSHSMVITTYLPAGLVSGSRSVNSRFQSKIVATTRSRPKLTHYIEQTREWRDMQVVQPGTATP